MAGLKPRKDGPLNMLKRLFRLIFKPGECSWRDPKCYRKQTRFGCVCGKSGGDKKAAQRQEDLTRQQTAGAQSQAAELRSQQQGIADQLRQRLLESVSMNELETQRYGNLRTAEPEFNSLLRELAMGLNPVKSVIPYEDTFEPEFARLKDRMSTEAAARGIYGSGLQIENMGRAGVDLAIQQAQKRQENKRLNEQIAASRRAELGNFIGGQQGLEESRRGREVQGQQMAATGPADIMSGANRNASDIIGQARQSNFALESGDVDYYRKKAAENDAALGKLLGTGVGAVAGIPFGPTGMMTGAQFGGSLFGGGGSMGTPPFNPYDQFAATRPPSGSDLRASYKYGSKRPGAGDWFYGGKW